MELKQLNDRVMKGKTVVEPISFDKSINKDKTLGLEAVSLMKEKQCGKVKGQTCSNRSKQRNYMSKDINFSSPTTSLESILMTLIFDAWDE